MKKIFFVLFAAVLVSASALQPASANEKTSGLGVGIFYDVPLKWLSDAGFDSDYISYLLAYRHALAPGFSAEMMLNYLPVSDEKDMALFPTASIIWGRILQLGLGIGTSYAKITGESGEWGDAVFLLQGGADMPIGDAVSVNLSLFYYFEKFGDITDVGTDRLNLAARIFFRF